MTDRRIAEPREIFAGRYETGETIGSGGMATVRVAYDTVRKQRVALKCLRAEAGGEHRAYSRSLFEREYYILSELAHPHVVDVYDYGVADELPYYTMELLDGGDLRDLAPLPFQRVCEIFHDLCSILALLHSRRLVYRDLNPRNVRCTDNGTAKLIDFGAMMPMGHPRMILGTPGFVAPEIVNLQAVDGRADLYALGCCLYFALTRRAPHASRDFVELRELWSSPPVPPSHLVADIPPQLDELVIDLLHQEPLLRPATAAEVMDRLAAIGGLLSDETKQVSGAYLITPPLIGRETLVEEVRQHIVEASAGNGRVLLFESAAGTGRTRMLDACVVEAKLAGSIVARAAAIDGQNAEYGVAKWLASQLIDAIPNALDLAAPGAAVLGHILPEIREAYRDLELIDFSDSRDRRPIMQSALRKWLLRLAGDRSIVLAVDDLHAVDEPTVALLALLTDAIATHSICLVLTAQGGAEGKAEIPLSVIRENARAFYLPALTADETQRLVSAVFGESPRTSILGDCLFQTSAGRPRDIIQLAQYLIERKIVEYQAGTWKLPSEIDIRTLPSSASEAAVQTIANLSRSGRQLACVFALSTVKALTFEDCVALRENTNQGTLVRTLSELVALDMLQVADEYYSLSKASWADALPQRVDEAELRLCHERLARMVEIRQQSGLARVHHLRLAGQTEAALDAMVEFSSSSILKTGNDTAAFQALFDSLPDSWRELFEWAIAAAEATGRPPLAIYTIRLRLSGMLVMDRLAESKYLYPLLDQLRHDVGLNLYEQLATEEMEDGQRLKAALDEAQARYDSLPEHDRVLSPLAALSPLVKTEVVCTGMAVTNFDYELLHSLPDMKPFEVFSPAIGAVNLLVQGLRQRMAGRSELARTTYGELLRRLAQPDRSGLDATYADSTELGVINGLAMLDVVLGYERALDYAERLQQLPSWRLKANYIRMLHCYFRGLSKEGDVFKRDSVRQRIESTGARWLEGSHLLTEAIAHSAAEDLPRLREVLSEMENCAGNQPGWQPILHFVQGECYRLRGDLSQAEDHFAQALSSITAGSHQVWANVAGAYLLTLTARGRAAEAARLGEDFLVAASTASLGINEIFIRIPLSVAQAHAGRVVEGRRMINEVATMMEEQDVHGLIRGLVHEASARVAICEANYKQARADIRSCTNEVRSDISRTGYARCERLREELGHLGARESIPPGVSTDQAVMESEIHSRVLSAIGQCQDRVQMTRRTLQFLVAESRAAGGALFVLEEGKLGLSATLNIGHDIQHMTAWAEEQFSAAASSGSELSGMRYPTPDSCEEHEKDSLALYNAVILRHEVSGKAQLSGIAVLISGRLGLASVTQTLSQILSRELTAWSHSQVGATRIL